MTREVIHEPTGKLRCRCGARFRKPRDLKHHLNGEIAERVVWINTDAPIHPRSAKKL